jgi:hypothetical protein
LGGWFPRNDRPAERELYCASMLVLLKPWKDLSELKTDDETFEQIFGSFVDGAPKLTLDIIENIQYYYECYDGAKRRREMDPTGSETGGHIDFEDDTRREDLTNDSFVPPSDAIEVTEEDIETAHDLRVGMRERLNAEVALNTAFDRGVFSDSTLQTAFLAPVDKADTEDLKTFRAWEEQLKAACRKEAEEGGPALFPNLDGAAPSSVTNEQPGVESRCQQGPVPSSTVNRPKRDLLKKEQRRAHDIIEKQLLNRLEGKYQTK